MLEEIVRDLKAEKQRKLSKLRILRKILFMRNGLKDLKTMEGELAELERKLSELNKALKPTKIQDKFKTIFKLHKLNNDKDLLELEIENLKFSIEVLKNNVTSKKEQIKLTDPHLVYKMIKEFNEEFSTDFSKERNYKTIFYSINNIEKRLEFLDRVKSFDDLSKYLGIKPEKLIVVKEDNKYQLRNLDSVVDVEGVVYSTNIMPRGNKILKINNIDILAFSDIYENDTDKDYALVIPKDELNKISVNYYNNEARIVNLNTNYEYKGAILLCNIDNMKEAELNNPNMQVIGINDKSLSKIVNKIRSKNYQNISKHFNDIDVFSNIDPEIVREHAKTYEHYLEYINEALNNDVTLEEIKSKLDSLVYLKGFDMRRTKDRDSIINIEEDLLDVIGNLTDEHKNEFAPQKRFSKE